MTAVLLDGRSIQDGSAVRGIGTYLRGLVAGLRAVGGDLDIQLLLEKDGRLPPAWASQGIRLHPTRLPHVPRHLRPFADPIIVRQALSREQPDVYHAVEFAQPLFPPMPVVITVHDLIPFIFPRQYPWMQRERRVSLRQVRHADAVIAVSASTAADLVRLGDVNPRRITVIPEAVARRPSASLSKLEAVRTRFDLPESFVLAVGTFEPRKRIGALADVVARIRLHHDVGLVIAGFQGNFATAVAQTLAEAHLTSHTRVLGHVTSDDLDCLYQLSECLLFTSAYEGFGLPPLEAMSWGTPVAVFRNSSLPEVVGNAGLVIADGDTVAMAEAVAALIAAPSLRSTAAAEGLKRAGQLSWNDTAAATLNVYKEAMNRR